MPVPTLISELSQTAGDNYPTGAESPSTADNYFRAHAAFIAQLRDGTGMDTPDITGPATITANSASAALRVTQTGAGNALLVEDSANPDSTPWLIDASGQMIQGYTTNVTGYSYQSHGGFPLSGLRWTAASTGPFMFLGKSRSATIGTFSIVSSGDTLGTFSFSGDDGAAFIAGASISAAVDGTPGTNDMPGRLIFSTTADGAASTTERLRITSAGAWGLAGANYGTAGQTIVSAGSSSPPTWGVQAMRGRIDGLIMSTAGSSTTMTIGAGEATDSTSVATLIRSSSIAKTTSAWAVGNAQGGLDTGTIANSTWYYFFVIRRPDTGVVDVVFSTSSSAPTLPTNYTQYRYIGAGLTNGSAQWTKFIQMGDRFFWDTPVLDVTTATSGTSAATATATVPRGRKMEVIANIIAQNQVYISDLSNSDLAPSTTLAPLATASNTASQARVTTNTSAQFRYRASVNGTLYIATIGWEDDRDQNT